MVKAIHLTLTKLKQLCLVVSATSLIVRPAFLFPSNFLAALYAGKFCFLSVVLYGVWQRLVCICFYRKGKVPDVLIATIEPPTGINVQGRGCLIQARLCRPKRAESRGDQQAKEVSDGKLLYLLRFFQPITLTALLSPYSYVGFICWLKGCLSSNTSCIGSWSIN